MKIKATLIVGALFALTASPAMATDLSLLRDIICKRESTPLKHPEAAYNKNPNGTVDLGSCQINTDTLAYLGYLSTNWRKDATKDPTKIFTDSPSIAMEVLQLAHQTVKAKGWRRNAFNYAFLYGCGVNSIPSPQGKCAKSAFAVARVYDALKQFGE